MPTPKKVLNAKDYRNIRSMASQGVRETDIAKGLGISYNTWLRLKQEDEQCKSVFQEAKRIEEGELFGVLYEKAMKGDSTSAMFLLKTRHGYREFGNEQATGNAVQVNITLPAAKKAEDYEK